jgi:proteic killer suppression protein
MIHSFGNRATEDPFHGTASKAARTIPMAIWPIVLRKLDLLNAAHDLRDLRVPPGNRLEPLNGEWSGHFRIRINDQYRLVFRWIDGNAQDVLIADYHK